VVDRTGLEPV